MNKNFIETGLISEGLVSIENIKTHLHGFANKQHEVVIDTKYEDVGNFKHGLAPVKLNDKFGFINKDGVEVIPFIFEDAGDFDLEISLVNKDNKYGCIDLNGAEVFPISVEKSAIFDVSELYDFIGDQQLTRMREFNFTEDTRDLIAFLAEAKIRSKVKEIIKGKNLSQSDLDKIEEKAQNKINKAKEIIDEKIRKRNESIVSQVVSDVDNIDI